MAALRDTWILIGIVLVSIYLANSSYATWENTALVVFIVVIAVAWKRWPRTKDFSTHNPSSIAHAIEQEKWMADVAKELEGLDDRHRDRQPLTVRVAADGTVTSIKSPSEKEMTVKDLIQEVHKRKA